MYLGKFYHKNNVKTNFDQQMKSLDAHNVCIVQGQDGFFVDCIGNKGLLACIFA